MRKKLLLIIGIAMQTLVQAQTVVPYFGKINWISGYEKEITGENLGYFSVFPDYANTALLTRTTNGNRVIEWETSVVPQNIKGQYVYFSWVAAHSTGTSSGLRNFDLYVENEKVLTFTTYPKNQFPDWTFGAADSTRLVFQQKKRDGAYDAHGLAYLRLPLSRVTPGKPVRLKVVGQKQNSNDWYMTFKFSFEEKIELRALPFLLKNEKQVIRLTTLHFGNPKPLIIKVNNADSYKYTAMEGIGVFDVPVHAVQKPENVLVQVFDDKKMINEQKLLLNPIVNRTLYFIHHSHTDIGYSHIQPEVERIHNKNIDDALDMIEATKSYPEEAQFKWNVESLWAVENYIRQANNAQKQKFIEAVKQGKICLSAFYANIMTGISEPEEIFHFTEYAQKLKKEYGINIATAMSSDVPGFMWTTTTAFAKGGVKYFSCGPNYLGEQHPYSGDRVGHFVKNWGDKPVWWVSPSGEEKLLFWVGGKGYSSWHGTAPGAVFDRGVNKIATYMDELNRTQYSYDLVQWRYNIVADNGPIDTSISRFVALWNERYASPKIILSTVDRMFEDFEKKYGNQIPVVKGDITPYWEDGAVSTAEELGRSRQASLRLQQLSTLYAMLNPKLYKEDKFYEAWKQVILFSEHTWGAHNSITSPDIPFVTEQWQIKRQFMLDAEKNVQEIENELLTPYKSSEGNTIVVFNTASWKRSAPVKLTGNINAKSVKDAAGNLHPLQKLSDGSFVFMASDVPPLGKITYTLSNEIATQAASIIQKDNSLSNGKITLNWNSEDGSITNINTGSDFNYAGTFGLQGMNSYWYVPGLDPMKAVSNEKVNVTVTESGPVVTTVNISSAAPGANSLKRNISLYAGEDILRIHNLIDKKAIRTKEAVHFGFPFNPTFKNSILDAGYGSMKYLGDQLPGSNMDYLCGRRWIDVSSFKKGMQLIWVQMPMIEPDSMIDERKLINEEHKVWKVENKPTANWFSYVMNNYWHTNFKIDQEGIAQFEYVLRPHEMVNQTEIERAATNITQPLFAFRTNEVSGIKMGSLFELNNPYVTVTSITPDGEGGAVVRLFNPEAMAVTTAFKWKDWYPKEIINMEKGERMSADKTFIMAGMGLTEIKILNVFH